MSRLPRARTRSRSAPSIAGGYGVRLGEATTAFDVLGVAVRAAGLLFRRTASPMTRDVAAVTRNFHRLHLNLAQLYDWAYRHSTLLPPTEQLPRPARDSSVRSMSSMRCSSALASPRPAPCRSATRPCTRSAHDELAE